MGHKASFLHRGATKGLSDTRLVSYIGTEAHNSVEAPINPKVKKWSDFLTFGFIHKPGHCNGVDAMLKHTESHSCQRVCGTTHES